MKDIRQICELRKEIHRDVAEMLGLSYKPVFCCCPVECPDFCSICDREQLQLEQQITNRRLPDVDWQAMLSLRLPPDTAPGEPVSEQIYRIKTEQAQVAEADFPAYNLQKKTEAQPSTTNKLYGRFSVAGSQFSDANRIIYEICKDDELLLLREPDNSHDPNAIRVMFPYNGSTHFLGYIPQSKSRELAALIDSGLGHLLVAKVCYLQDDEGYGPIIRFNLFIKQSK